MTFRDELLEQLVTGQGWAPDWPDVLQRAGAGHSTRRVTRRRMVIVLAVLAAVLVPLAALAASNNWWFLKLGHGPVPTNAPLVVKEGTWDGHPWQLIAYPSTTDGLCVSVTPRGSTSEGAAMGCGTFTGISRTPETKAAPDMTITYLSGGASDKLPAYVAGPVIEKAVTVEIRFANGDVMRVPTFTAPEPLSHVRFYATPIPTADQSTPTTFVTFLKWVAGLDANGNVVACLAPLTAKDGISALSDCR
jgi:hypothetical protein